VSDWIEERYGEAMTRLAPGRPTSTSPDVPAHGLAALAWDRGAPTTMKTLHFALVPFLTLASPALGDDVDHTRKTLTGLRGVYVLVEDLPGEAEKAGFDSRTFQADVEVRLNRESGHFYLGENRTSVLWADTPGI
jgi:hypothetical protein